MAGLRVGAGHLKRQACRQGVEALRPFRDAEFPKHDFVGPEGVGFHRVSPGIEVRGVNVPDPFGPEFIQDAACTALREGSAFSADMAREYAARAKVVVETLSAAPGLRPIAPQAGMFVMVDIRACGISASEFAARLFADEGIVVLAGEAFGTQAAGHIRIGLVHGADVLRGACAKIAALAQRLNNQP